MRIRAKQLLSLLLLTLVGACSSGASGAAGSGPKTTTTTRFISSAETGVIGLQYRVEDDIVVHNVPAPAEKVLGRMGEAFEALGLPAPIVDLATQSAQVAQHKLTRTLGEERLSRYLNCGQRMAGPLVNSSRVELTVLVQILPAPDGTSTAQTQVQAYASPFDPVIQGRACTSTHQLEIALVETVARLLEEAPGGGV